MKIVTYKCDECKGEIPEEKFIELKSADEETRMNFRNNFEEERRFELASVPGQMHFCGKECFMNFFWMSSSPKKQICEPIIEVGVDHGSGTDHHVEVLVATPVDEETPAKNKGGWPKGKPRGSKIAENLRKNKVEVVQEPEVVPVTEANKKLGRRTADNDVFIQKLEFAKSLGYETISAALAEIDKYEFEKQFSKSQFSK